MSYQDYLDGLSDGISVGFNAGLRKGYELGQRSGYLSGYQDGYEDRSSCLPYSPRKRLLEYEMIMPKIPPVCSYEPLEIIPNPILKYLLR